MMLLFSFFAFALAKTLNSHLSPINYPTCVSQNIGVSRFDLDARLSFVGHFGSAGQLLFAMSESQTLYRSIDDGVSWSTVTASELKVPVEDAAVRFIVTTANTKLGNAQVKLYLGGAKYLWTTTDGLSFKRYDQVPIVLITHPTMDDVALAMFDKNPCEIYITTNFGQDWTKASNGRSPQWVHSSTSISFMHMNNCGYPAPIATTTWDASKNPKATDFVHKGLFKTLTDIERTGYVTSTDAHEQVFLAINDADELVISRNAKNWIHAFIPGELGETFTQFAPYGVDDGSIIVNARSGTSSQDLRVGHLYISGNDTELFSLSMPNNVRAQIVDNGVAGWGDFEKVHSLDGVFIANAFKSGTELGIETYLTFDMGGKWRRLRAPLVDSFGVPTGCVFENGCYLNLFGLVDSHATLTDFGGYGRFYSVPSAIGIIFATGNYGSVLNQTGDVNTYFSRDAGVTWQQVREGRWAYEIADHGALLALAPRDEPANHILYTWNEGLDWLPCNFTDNAISIENIITEVSFRADKFILYGETKNAMGRTVGTLATLDFSRVHKRECVGEENPDGPGSDFELWEPTAGVDCVLGMHTSYVRRKPDVACFNADDREVNKRVYSLCQCTRDDFECGPCYSSKGNDCVLQTKCKLPTVAEQCDNGCYYYDDPTQAKFVRIAGDACFGGMMWENRRGAKPCLNRTDCRFPPPPTRPTNPSTSSGNGGGSGGMVAVVLIVLALVACGIGIGCVCVTKRPASLYAKLSALVPGRGGSEQRYRKLNFDSTTKDTTSFFDDDDLANREQQ